MLRVVFTDHGLQRIRERGISRAQVEKAIWKGSKYDAGEGLREAVHGNETNAIVVIYQITGTEEVLVITAYHA